MKDLQKMKALAVRMLTLSAELFREISGDESERERLINEAKKTQTETYYIFRA